MKTLVTGGRGVLAQEIAKAIPGCLAPSKSEFDVRNKKQIYDYLESKTPDTVIHAAALTGIRQCEENQRLAYDTNVLGTSNLVEAVIKLGRPCKFVYISSACVFKGDRGNYSEDDVPYPKNYYGLTKLLGEFVITRSLSDYLVVRTNFVGRKPWPYPQAFIDRFGTYLFADDLALAIKDVIGKGISGVVHICGDKTMSMFDLAKMVSPNVKPTTLSGYNGPPLTVNMTLVSNRIPPYRIRETPLVRS